MVALTARHWLHRTVSVACALVFVLVLAGGLAAASPSGFEARLDEARQALAEARIETAEKTARDVLAALDEAADVENQEELSLRALDLVAQCRYSLGDESGAREAIDRMLRLRPGFEPSDDLAGEGYVDLVSARRAETIGTLVMSCRPEACAWVEITGVRLPVGEDGRVLVHAGTHDLVAGRRNFAPEPVEAVEIPAGAETTVEVTLSPVARDVIVTTEPEGVRVVVDGELVGTTRPAPPELPEGVAGPPEPAEELPAVLTVPSLAPGPHQIRLEAECFKTVERNVDIVLDALDPGPLRLEPVTLARARGSVVLTWERGEGVVALDGRPVEAETVDVCPGRHHASLQLAGRTVWFESFEVRDGQTVNLQIRPRPTLVIRAADRAFVGDELGREWNVEVLSESVYAMLGPMVERWGRDDLSVPAASQTPLRETDTRLAGAVRKAAPDGRVFLAWLEAQAGPLESRRLLLVDIKHGLAELVAWHSPGDDELAAARNTLLPRPIRREPFAGFDVAARADGRLVIGRTHPEGPAAKAGVQAGMLLIAVNGTPVEGTRAFDALRGEWTPGEEVTLGIEGADGQYEVKLAPAANLRVPWRSTLAREPLLGVLAHAEVAMEFARGADRAAGTLLAGFALSALGQSQEAAAALDRASLDDALDPSQDARATAWVVLAEELRKLGEGGYAAEIDARRAELDEARFAGRAGPPMRWSAGAPDTY